MKEDDLYRLANELTLLFMKDRYNGKNISPKEYAMLFKGIRAEIYIELIKDSDEQVKFYIPYDKFLKDT